MNSICGLDCPMHSKGRLQRMRRNRRPSVPRRVCHCVLLPKQGHGHCGDCSGGDCELKEALIAEFNALGIEDIAKVTDLNALKGSYINLEYTLPSGQAAKLLDDEKIYLGNQICKQDSGRCYGLAADEDHLLVCEYGDGGADAEIILFRKRKMTHGDRIVPSFCNVVFFSSEQMRIPA